MKSQAQILKGMSAIPRLARGRIGVMRQKSKGGGAFHNLQYTKGGRHHVKYVPEAQLAYPPRPKAELPKAGASAVRTRRRRRTTGGSCRSSTSTSS